MREVLKALKALSDETRLRILKLLQEKECCVCEVMQALDISQTRASRNLNILYDAGFLKLRKEGLWSLYSLNQGNAPAYFPELITAVEKALAANQTAIRDKRRLDTAERVGPACVRKCKP